MSENVVFIFQQPLTFNRTNICHQLWGPLDNNGDLYAGDQLFSELLWIFQLIIMCYDMRLYMQLLF